MSKMIGAIAVAAVVAATVAWSHSMAVKQDAAALAAQPGKAGAAVQTDGSGAENTRDNREMSDREHGWGPFRTVDW
jgi:hypothetical protein